MILYARLGYCLPISSDVLEKILVDSAVLREEQMTAHIQLLDWHKRLPSICICAQATATRPFD